MSAAAYTPMRKTGRCANGAERDRGTQWHAVQYGFLAALCGTTPGRRSDWSLHTGGAVTCPRCLRKIVRATGAAS